MASGKSILRVAIYQRPIILVMPAHFGYLGKSCSRLIVISIIGIIGFSLPDRNYWPPINCDHKSILEKTFQLTERIIVT